MASASSPCRRLLLLPSSSSSSSLIPSHPAVFASPLPDLPPSIPSPLPVMPDDPTAADGDGSSPPEDDPRPTPPPVDPSPRKTRFPRACTSRPPAAAAARPPLPERRPVTRREKEEQQVGRVITPLIQAPPPAQLQRWELRSMWQLASVLNFLHVFRHLLNISVEFSAEELETALITPNSTLDDVHMPLLKLKKKVLDAVVDNLYFFCNEAIPPVTRMALGRATWVTVLCRKLRDWWHWVADGDIPIVASHGTEIEKYKTLDPGTRVLILKALCDIRVEQEDIRSFIDNSLKHGIQLSAFRKERIGGDSHGISYWYEDDPIIGHRLYREIRRVEAKKVKTKGSSTALNVSYQWETVATNLDEFREVSEKLFTSKSRTEASLGKKLKIDSLPEIEKIHKKKERLLKKQHREALLLDSFLAADGITAGRSLRDRKPVTYTFDDYDRSINEAIKITKKRQSSPENVVRRAVGRPEVSANGKRNGTSPVDSADYDNAESPKLNEYEETDVEQLDENLDRSNRQRKRPQRYSEKDYVDTVSDIDADFDSDDDIVGEAVYDEEYLRSRKQRKLSSASEGDEAGDEEYRWEEENADDDDDEEEEEYSLSTSEDAERQHNYKKLKLPGRTRRETKLRSVDDLQTGLRRSKRALRSRINYQQYDLSETDTDSTKPGKSNATDPNSDASEEIQLSTASQDSHGEGGEGSEQITDNKMTEDPVEVEEHKEQQQQQQSEQKTEENGQVENGVQQIRFLDLNELAPGTGFDDGPSTKDENGDNF